MHLTWTIGTIKQTNESLLFCTYFLGRAKFCKTQKGPPNDVFRHSEAKNLSELKWGEKLLKTSRPSPLTILRLTGGADSGHCWLVCNQNVTQYRLYWGSTPRSVDSESICYPLGQRDIIITIKKFSTTFQKLDFSVSVCGPRTNEKMLWKSGNFLLRVRTSNTSGLKTFTQKVVTAV